MQRDGFEIQAAIEIDGRDDVLKGRDDPFDSCDMLLFEGKRSRGRRDLSGWGRWARDSSGCTALSVNQRSGGGCL